MDAPALMCIDTRELLLWSRVISDFKGELLKHNVGKGGLGEISNALVSRLS